MRMVLDNALVLASDVWTAKVPPHQVSVFGQAKVTGGGPTILTVGEATFDPNAATLLIDLDNVAVLNQGTTSRAVIVAITPSSSSSLESATKIPEKLSYGPGDKDFLALVRDRLHGEALEVAQNLLQQIRAVSPGDLKRGLRMNFSNTPDNFWYAIVQPREQALSITIRGEVSRLRPSKLELKDDRPGYTRFKVSKQAELDEAVRLISSSRRR